jgi:NTP pyrophosphatase (non-canonical NTP hydrolase)
MSENESVEDQRAAPGYIDTGEYAVDVLRNVVPGRFYGDNVSDRVYFSALNNFVEAGMYLDKVKKAVIYGKHDPGLLSVSDTTARQVGYCSTVDPDIAHAIIGIATEATELVEALLSAIDMRVPLDTVNAREEIGDVLWYSAFLADRLGTTLPECAQINTVKLRKRYPDNFTNKQALERDLDGERQVLENGKQTGA